MAMKVSISKKIAFIFGLTLLTVVSFAAPSIDKDVAGDNGNSTLIKVLVVALPNNVCSNYFPNSMITEATGIPTDSIDLIYNQVIAHNIIAANKDKKYKFIFPHVTTYISKLVNEVKLQGNEEEKYADLSKVDYSSYKLLMKETGSDYVLFLNQHYLKWQETPLHTLFHITSYSLYDKNRSEVTHGNNYFTSMNLENKDRLNKDCRKSSSKIASNIVKSIEK